MAFTDFSDCECFTFECLLTYLVNLIKHISPLISLVLYNTWNIAQLYIEFLAQP